MRLRTLLLTCVFGLVTCWATADEGLWPFTAVPRARIKAKYAFDITDAWLNHLQSASVRFGDGGSGAFVSADGLVLTNHHVAGYCLQELSSPARDYFNRGFYAKTRAQETRCPNLELDVLKQITEVTDRVNASVKPGTSDASAARAQHAAMAALEKDCATGPDIRCDVVSLYSGALFHLYKYKKYTDVRLVFAPEFAAAFFGGDPDNFEFPRYDLDIAFFRVYENDRPVRVADYLQWSRHALREGDLVFAAGNPGLSSRQNTMNQLEFLNFTLYPFMLKNLQRRIDVLQKFAAQSTENTRIAQEYLFKLQNALKQVIGFKAALSDSNLMRRKIMDERIHLIRTQHSALGRREFAAYRAIDKALETQHELFLPHRFVELGYGFRGDLAWLARNLVRLIEEKSKPNGDRLREYRDSALPSLEADLFSSDPIYKSLEALLLGDSLNEMQEQLGAEHPVVKKVLQGRSSEEVARELVSGTRLDEVAFRRELYAGGFDALAKCHDPLIVLMRDIDPDARALRQHFDDEVDSAIQANGAIIAKSRFLQAGFYSAPDATFTPRLSFGQIKGYTEDGRGYLPKGTSVSAFTDLKGAFDRADEHGDKPPYQLPPSWTSTKKKLELKTPLNFVSTVDLLPGSSGSPVINKGGELVGVIFDGNIQSLGWRFLYDETTGRAIGVDGRAILEVLRKVYKANALAKELTRKPKQEKPS